VPFERAQNLDDLPIAVHLNRDRVSPVRVVDLDREARERLIKPVAEVRLAASIVIVRVAEI
jgi:hypothetical protein